MSKEKSSYLRIFVFHKRICANQIFCDNLCNLWLIISSSPILKNRRCIFASEQKRQAKMNVLLSDLWPALTIIVPIVVLYFGYIQQLRIRVAVLEETVKHQQTLIENQQKRMDSHSKKQDDILDLITDLKLEMVKQIGKMSSELGTIASDVKNINRSFKVNDQGVVIP